MRAPKLELGALEARFFAYTQLRGLGTVPQGTLQASLGLSAAQERRLLSRLTVAGLIARVSRGLYLVPPRLPLGGRWSPDEVLALNTLMRAAKARYQICGPNAFNRYGFDDQIPARLYAYNTRFSGQRTIGTVTLVLIKVANSRLGAVELLKTATGERATFSSRTRTLVDAVYDWARFNSLPRAYDWIGSELAAKRVTAAEIVRLTRRFGDVGTIRRMGVLLERWGASERTLAPLRRALPPSNSLIPWIPRRRKRGRIDRRWGVVLNDTE